MRVRLAFQILEPPNICALLGTGLVVAWVGFCVLCTGVPVALLLLAEAKANHDASVCRPLVRICLSRGADLYMSTSFPSVYGSYRLSLRSLVAGCQTSVGGARGEC